MPGWVSPLTLEEMAEFSRLTASGRIGMAFTAIGDDWLEGSLTVNDRTINGDGTLHHGALAILAETLASVGASMCVDMSRQACLGQILQLQHIAAVNRGPLTGRAKPLWVLSTHHLWEIQIRDGAGALACVAQLTTAVVNRLDRPAP